MRVLGNLVLKELRELLTPQTLLPMVAIMVLFVFVGRLLRGERARTEEPEAVLVVDADQSALTRRIKWTFQSRELLLIPSGPGIDDALAHTLEEVGRLIVLSRVRVRNILDSAL